MFLIRAGIILDGTILGLHFHRALIIGFFLLQFRSMARGIVNNVLNTILNILSRIQNLDLLDRTNGIVHIPLLLPIEELILLLSNARDSWHGLLRHLILHPRLLLPRQVQKIVLLWMLVHLADGAHLAHSLVVQHLRKFIVVLFNVFVIIIHQVSLWRTIEHAVDLITQEYLLSVHHFLLLRRLLDLTELI